MAKTMFAAAVVLLSASSCSADMYLHAVATAKGTNNRANEQNVNRNNNNRLWDSQNNNKGGYSIGVDEGDYEVGVCCTFGTKYRARQTRGSRENSRQTPCICSFIPASLLRGTATVARPACAVTCARRNCLLSVAHGHHDLHACVGRRHPGPADWPDCRRQRGRRRIRCYRVRGLH